MTRRVALVTGASGFVGRQTLEPLRALGFLVHGWERGTDGDLRDAGCVRAVLGRLRPTHVLHCAWQVTPGHFWEAPENLDWVAASLILARESVAAGVTRFVGIGSCAEYDWSDGGALPRREDDPCQPATIYGKAKHATAKLQAALFARTGTSFAWARLFHLFGPHEAPGRFVPSLLAALQGGGQAACRHGQLVRDFMAVQDAGAALAAVLAAPTYGAINICTGRGIRLGELARRIAAACGCPERLVVESRPSNDPPAMVGDPLRLRSEVVLPFRQASLEDADSIATLPWSDDLPRRWPAAEP